MFSPQILSKHQLFTTNTNNWRSTPYPENPKLSYILEPYYTLQQKRKCVWTGNILKLGDFYYKFTEEIRFIVHEYLMQLIKITHINEYIINDILNYLLPKSHSPPLFIYFEYDSFLGHLIRNNEAQKNFAKKDLIQDAKTRYGRRIKAPERFQDKEYIKGSGSGVCDQFDRGFAGKNHGDYGSKLWEKEDKTVTYKKNDFVVDDNEEEYYNDISSEEEDCDYSETDESELDDDELFDDE